MRLSFVSFSDRMELAGGHTRGFDYMRLFLAVCVITFHSFATTHDWNADHAIWRGWWGPPLRLMLPMFFALSGFLVMGSFFRTIGLAEFLLLRALRIFPALVAEISLSALIIGPVLTEFSLVHYFSSRSFFSYFLNIIGDVHFHLPGLFLHNRLPGKVNGSLWTLPFEGLSYACLAILALAGLVRHRHLFTAFCLAALVVFALHTFVVDDVRWVVPGEYLVMCFLAGCTFYMYRRLIPWNAYFFCGSIVASLLFLAMDRLVWLAVPFLTYATVYLGLTNPPKTVALTGDYSYGLYLFVFPIQQAVVMLAPGEYVNGWSVFAIALPIGLAYACLSWHVIEHPILRSKRTIASMLRLSMPQSEHARVSSA